MSDAKTDAAAAPPRQHDQSDAAETMTLGAGALIFLIGFALGLPLATVGWNFFADHADFVAALVFSLVVLVLTVAGIVLLYRRWIWDRVFQTAEVRLQAFAEPLGELARHAAEQRAPEAIAAAQSFARIALARWAWLSTRRWLIASITALIAAMAALAGTALLFRQNELIAEQIVRLDRQNELITMEAELADAQRAAGLLGELTAIADGLEAAFRPAAAGDEPPAIVDARQLPRILQARIIAASLAARPYRIIDRTAEREEVAAARLRPDLPKLAQYVAALPPPAETSELSERPVSPERGLILLLLYHSGVKITQALHIAGADFSAASMTDATLAMLDCRNANLVRADFSRSALNQANFTGGFLQGARFRDAVIVDSVFAKLPAQTEGEAPEPGAYTSQLAGADFTRAVMQGDTFNAARLDFSRFDDAVLNAVSFRDASLAGATFRNAALFDADFAGADLRSVDFDGAVVVGAEWLQALAGAAAPDTFEADRFRLDPISEADVRAIAVVYAHLGVEIPDEAVAGKPLFRVARVKPFD